jgi:hypothetical protein
MHKQASAYVTRAKNLGKDIGQSPEKQSTKIGDDHITVNAVWHKPFCGPFRAENPLSSKSEISDSEWPKRTSNPETTTIRVAVPVL